jgi:uncharacterized protein YjbI with pentapeptide repeats
MNIGRRNILFAGIGLATTSSPPAQAYKQEKRVSQQELDEAIRLHGMWLADIKSGKRCVFGGSDLSGLKFGNFGKGPIDLNGADFGQADLSETEADDILVHHCNFNGATFDQCRWRQPVFAFSDMRRASAKRVKWGVPGRRQTAEHSVADFSHAVLNNTDLFQAEICGFFYGTKFVGSCLLEADLSFSDFLGCPKHVETTLSGANLSGAKLRDCRISSVSFFNADCTNADFSRSTFSNVRAKSCNLSGARFHEAEIERTTFTPDQICHADSRGVKMEPAPSA